MQYTPHPNNQPPLQPGQSWQPQQYPASSNAYYPPQQFQRPMPPPPPPKKKPRKRLWIGLAIFASALVLCIAVSVAAANTPTPPPAAVTTTPTTTTVPTQAPTATATPRPKPTTAISGNSAVTHGTPRLGGPISDFIGKYGQPNNHTNDHSYHWLRDSASNTDGLIVWELTHPRVDSIDVAAVNGDMPNLTSAIALCTAYNPSDAHQMKRIPLVDSSGMNAGFDVIYTSGSLAHTFSSGDFTDSNGNKVQAGSFDIQYLYKGDGTQNIDSCSILPGQQQTHL